MIFHIHTIGQVLQLSGILGKNLPINPYDLSFPQPQHNRQRQINVWH
jgi:hypothetical protein